MKQTVIRSICIAAASLMLLASSCKKTEVKDLQKAADRLTGTWTVQEINIHTTDTAGNTLSDSTLLNQGTVNFAKGDKSVIGGGYFDHADFTGNCSESDLVLYFRTVAAGDPIANDGWSLLWDADPDDLRVQFWAESAGGSYHISTNHSYGNGGQQIYYVVQPIYQNRRIFYTWKLKK